MTSNALQYWNNQETKRSNMAKEAEAHRHNRAVEAIDQQKARSGEVGDFGKLLGGLGAVGKMVKLFL